MKGEGELLKILPGLYREGQEEFVRHAVKTYIGMAHLASTGPAGKTCRECQFWLTRWQWFPEGVERRGAPKPAKCQMYKAFTHLSTRQSPAVPHHAEACKWFKPAERVQPLHRPEKKLEDA